MLDLKISAFENAVSRYTEIAAKMDRNEPYSSEELREKDEELERLRIKFSFIIDAVNYTSYGKSIIDLYNDWKERGENSWNGQYELPLIFLSKIGAYK